MEWSRIARETIAELHKTIPADTDLKERKRILRDAYPFGPREYWPYKAWCRAQRDYLKGFGPQEEVAPLFADLPRDPVTGRPVIA